MTTNPVAEAELNEKARVYYDDTGSVNTNVHTLTGSEFTITPQEELATDGLLEHLNVEEAVYGFKSDNCWIYVSHNDVKLLKTMYRGERLPTAKIKTE